MGLPGIALSTGFSQAGWTAIGLVLGNLFELKNRCQKASSSLYKKVSVISIYITRLFSVTVYKDDKRILLSSIASDQ